MAISPLAGTIYANQVAPAASSIQSDQQAKFDMQSTLAATVANTDKEKIEEIRPTEESYKIDPQNQHEKKSNSQNENDNNENNKNNEQILEQNDDNDDNEKGVKLDIVV